MGLSGPDENAVVLRRRDGLAETRCCHRSWPLWARNGHAKPGFQEPLTLILGQAPRRRWHVFLIEVDQLGCLHRDEPPAQRNVICCRVVT